MGEREDRTEQYNIMEEYRINSEIANKLKFLKFRNTMLEVSKKSVESVDGKIKNSCLMYGADLENEEDFRIEQIKGIYEEYMREYRTNMYSAAGLYLACHKLGVLEKVNLENQKIEKMKIHMVYKKVKTDIVEKAVSEKPDEKEHISVYDTKVYNFMERLKAAKKEGNQEEIEKCKEEYKEIEEEGRELLGNNYPKYAEVNKRIEKVKEEHEELEEKVNSMDGVIGNLENEGVSKIDEMTAAVEESTIQPEGYESSVTIGEFLKEFGKEAVINTGKSILAGIFVGTFGPAAIEAYIMEKVVKKMIKCDDDYITSMMDKFIEKEKKFMEKVEKYVKNDEAFVNGDRKKEEEIVKKNIETEITPKGIDEQTLPEDVEEKIESKEIEEDKIYSIHENIERASRFGRKKGSIVATKSPSYGKDFEENKLERELEEGVR